MFSNVPGLRVVQAPVLKIDVPRNAVAFDQNFTGSWGGQSGVHSELFASFRDGIMEQFNSSVATSYEPKMDGLRVPLGQEFSYSFSPATFKRPRTPSTTRVTPDGKGKYVGLFNGLLVRG